METIKDYNGEHVFIGNPDNDEEAKEVMDRIKKEAYAVGKVWAYKSNDGFGALIDFKDIFNNTPKDIRTEAFFHLLEAIAGNVAAALDMPILKVLGVLNTKIIAEELQRIKEEE